MSHYPLKYLKISPKKARHKEKCSQGSRLLELKSFILRNRKERTCVGCKLWGENDAELQSLQNFIKKSKEGCSEGQVCSGNSNWWECVSIKSQTEFYRVTIQMIREPLSDENLVCRAPHQKWKSHGSSWQNERKLSTRETQLKSFLMQTSQRPY